MYGISVAYLRSYRVVAYFSQELLSCPGDYLSAVPVRNLEHSNPKTLA